MARTARKAVPATSDKAQARETPLDKVRKLIARVSNDKGPGNVPITDEDRRDAVIKATQLKELPVDVSAFVIKWAHLVHSSVTQATENATRADTQVKEAESLFKARKEALAKAKALQEQRTADEVRFAYSVVKVHKIMTNDQLAAAWGISKTGVSKMTAAAANADRLGVKGNNKHVSYLLTLGGKKSADLKREMDKPGATISTVREALTTTQSTTTRTQAEQQRGSADSLDVQAHKELAQVINTLRVLNKNGKRVADIGEVKATDLFKELAALVKENNAIKASNVVPLRPEPQPA